MLPLDKASKSLTSIIPSLEPHTWSVTHWRAMEFIVITMQAGGLERKREKQRERKTVEVATLEACYSTNNSCLLLLVLVSCLGRPM